MQNSNTPRRRARRGSRLFVIELSGSAYSYPWYVGWCHDQHIVIDSAQARKFASRADAECRIAAAGLRDYWERVEVVEVGEATP